MELIAEITHATFFPQDLLDETSLNYSIRRAVRGILINQNNEIALMHVKNKGYYKLPGGGMNFNETFEDTLKREAIEEAGAELKDIKKLGITIEVKAQSLKEIQFSYIYLATIVSLTKNNLEADEKEKGFELIFAKPLEALSLVQNAKASNDSEKYITLRERSCVEYYVNKILKLT